MSESSLSRVRDMTYSASRIRLYMTSGRPWVHGEFALTDLGRWMAEVLFVAEK